MNPIQPVAPPRGSAELAELVALIRAVVRDGGEVLDRWQAKLDADVAAANEIIARANLTLEYEALAGAVEALREEAAAARRVTENAEANAKMEADRIVREAQFDIAGRKAALDDRDRQIDMRMNTVEAREVTARERENHLLDRAREIDNRERAAREQEQLAAAAKARYDRAVAQLEAQLSAAKAEAATEGSAPNADDRPAGDG